MSIINLDLARYVKDADSIRLTPTMYERHGIYALLFVVTTLLVITTGILKGLEALFATLT
jgi:hypothetical protein